MMRGFLYTKNMNAKWLAHLIEYRQSENHTYAVQLLLHQKITRQAVLAKRQKVGFAIPTTITETEDTKLRLVEARTAHTYWRAMAKILPKWCKWKGRVPHGVDIANHLLDIGYHALSLVIQKKCEALDIPTEIGMLHTAHSAKAHPLVYDLMEPFRVMMVDEVLVTFLHMKKRPIETVNQDVIQDFLHDVYAVLHQQYYHKDRKVCISLSYWIDLILLEFRGAVSEKRKFKPRWTPLRHETRCNRKPPNQSEVK
jgi:CRISPR-associated endonuclease Cas1